MAILASPATALSIKEFNAKPPAEQGVPQLIRQRMSADLGRIRPVLTNQIRQYFYHRTPGGEVVSEGLDALYAELTAIELRARAGKADLSKIEIESVVVWVVNRSSRPTGNSAAAVPHFLKIACARLRDAGAWRRRNASTDARSCTNRFGLSRLRTGPAIRGVGRRPGQDVPAPRHSTAGRRALDEDRLRTSDRATAIATGDSRSAGRGSSRTTGQECCQRPGRCRRTASRSCASGNTSAIPTRSSHGTRPSPEDGASGSDGRYAKDNDGRYCVRRRGGLDALVGPASLGRALRIMDAVLKHLERSGYKIGVEKERPFSTYAIIHEQHVAFLSCGRA